MDTATVETKALANKVVEMCNDSKNFDVMEQMYAEEMVSVEPDGQATHGKQAVIDKSKKWADENEIQSESVQGPFFHGDDRFATQTTWKVTRNDTGKTVTLNEITVYTAKDGQLVREEFFFDGDRW